MIPVDVQQYRCQLQLCFFHPYRIEIRQPQDLPVRLGLFSVIEDHKTGRRNGQRFAAVKILLSYHDRIQVGNFFYLGRRCSNSISCSILHSNNCDKVSAYNSAQYKILANSVLSFLIISVISFSLF